MTLRMNPLIEAAQAPVLTADCGADAAFRRYKKREIPR